jgi:ubiquinone biosynthesis protein COQ9
VALVSAGAARADEASALAKAEAAVAAERVRSTQESLLEAQKLVAEKSKAVQDAKDFQERKKRENAEADGTLPLRLPLRLRARVALQLAARLADEKPRLTRLLQPFFAAAAFAAALAKGKK